MLNDNQGLFQALCSRYLACFLCTEACAHEGIRLFGRMWSHSFYVICGDLGQRARCLYLLHMLICTKRLQLRGSVFVRVWQTGV